MKASQASVYRETEELLKFSIGITERLRKSYPLRVMGERLINNLLDCLDYICIAVEPQQTGDMKLQAILGCIMKMTSVKLVYRQYYEFKEISRKQYSVFLGYSNQIAIELGRMKNKHLPANA